MTVVIQMKMPFLPSTVQYLQYNFKKAFGILNMTSLKPGTVYMKLQRRIGRKCTHKYCRYHDTDTDEKYSSDYCTREIRLKESIAFNFQTFYLKLFHSHQIFQVEICYLLYLILATLQHIVHF